MLWIPKRTISFETPKNMLKIMGKKIITYLRYIFCLSKPMVAIFYNSCVNLFPVIPFVKFPLFDADYL